MREQELDNILAKQKEVGVQIVIMSYLKSGKSWGLRNESAGPVFVLSWKPESGSWAVNRQTLSSRTRSYGASTSSYRSRSRAAESSCRLLWASSACCRSALLRNKWPDRRELFTAQIATYCKGPNCYIRNWKHCVSWKYDWNIFLVIVNLITKCVSAVV